MDQITQEDTTCTLFKNSLSYLYCSQDYGTTIHNLDSRLCQFIVILALLGGNEATTYSTEPFNYIINCS